MSFKQRLTARFERAVAQHDVPGVAFGVTRGGGSVFEQGFGVQRGECNDPPSAQSVFAIASMTKPLTCMAVLMLVDQGLLDLDAPAIDYLPEIGSLMVFEGIDDHHRVLIRPPKIPVTLRHLLTHRSGLGNETWNDDVLRYRAALNLPAKLPHELRMLASPLLEDPGQSWNYSMGVDWAGRIVEAATGKRLGEIMQRRIFEPLGMTSTSFALSPSMRARLVDAYERIDGTLRHDPTFAPPDQPVSDAGGGGLFSTLNDYLKFVASVLRGGDGLLEQPSFQAFVQDQIAPVSVGRLQTALPRRSHDVDLLPGIDCGWSLGFMVNRAPVPGGRPASSLAWAGVHNAYFWIDPEQDLAAVMMMQLLPFCDPICLDLLRDAERIIYEHWPDGA